MMEANRPKGSMRGRTRTRGREYDYQGDGSQGELERSGKPGLGILRDPDVRVLKRGNQGVTTTPQIIAFLTGPEPP